MPKSNLPINSLSRAAFDLKDYGGPALNFIEYESMGGVKWHVKLRICSAKLHIYDNWNIN